jgi:hypothetical protein
MFGLDDAMLLVSFRLGPQLGMIDPKIALIAEYVLHAYPDAGKFPRTALSPAGIAPKPLQRAIAGFLITAGCSWLLFAVVARGFICLCCRKASVSAAEIKPLAVIFRYYSVISGGSINIAAAENS